MCMFKCEQKITSSIKQLPYTITNELLIDDAPTIRLAIKKRYWIGWLAGSLV